MEGGRRKKTKREGGGGKNSIREQQNQLPELALHPLPRRSSAFNSSLYMNNIICKSLYRYHPASPTVPHRLTSEPLQVVVVIIGDLDPAPERLPSLADHILQLLVEAANTLVLNVVLLVGCNCHSGPSPRKTELPPPEPSARRRRRCATERKCRLAGGRWKCCCAGERVFVADHGRPFCAAGARDDGARGGTARDRRGRVATRARR